MDKPCYRKRKYFQLHPYFFSTKPIIVGQKYTYTVKAYNNRYNTNGRYNSKGLTANTKLSTVKLRGASLSGDKRSVKVSWNPVPGCNQYFVYRKTPSTGWARILALKSNVTSYTDQRPVSNNTNTYTVRAYYSPTKTLGGYNTAGCSVSVPRQEPKPRYTYDIKIINTYNEFYNILGRRHFSISKQIIPELTVSDCTGLLMPDLSWKSLYNPDSIGM